MSIINIPFSMNFLDTFSKKFFENKITTKELQETIIVVPSLVVLKNLQLAFLRQSSLKTVILPQIVALTDLKLSTDINLFDDNIPKDIQFKLKAINQNTISNLGRNLILKDLILKKDSKLSFHQALSMAEELSKLIDKINLEEINFDNVEDIIDTNFTHHWQDVVKFLSIIKDFWPQYIKENQIIEESLRKRYLYDIQGYIWKTTNKHIITLNILSFYPSILRLLKNIYQTQNSNIYIHGFDDNLFDNTNIPYQSPQKILHKIIHFIGANPKDIKNINNKENNNEKIIKHILDANVYKNFPPQEIASFAKNITIIHAEDLNEEARTIALAMRETLETKGKTAAIITNNLGLINKVKNELSNWNLEIEDSVGENLFFTPSANFFLLIIKIIKNNFAPVSLLSLLNHPFAFFGLSRAEIKKINQNLNLNLFRDNLSQLSLDYYRSYLKQKDNIKYQNEINFLNHFKNYFNKVNSVNKNTKFDFNEMLISHIELAEKASSYEEKMHIFSKQKGKQFSLFLTALLADSKKVGSVNIYEYINLLEKLLKQQTFFNIYNKHPRIFLYGQMQNNLIKHDLIIVSSLNEGSLPLTPKFNPWINKNIGKSLGFIPEESNLGIDSNNFLQLLGAKEVILTRSKKENHNITTPSRWLLKIETFFKFYYQQDCLDTMNIANNKYFLYLLQKNYYLSNLCAYTPTENQVFKFKTPERISATSYEKLLKNPYVYFVDKILNLRKLEEIKNDTKISNTQFGSLLHKSLEDYMKLNIENRNKQNLRQILNTHFKNFQNNTHFKIFNQPALDDIIDTFNDNKLNDFQNIEKSLLETKSSINIELCNQKNIILTAIVDRIDILKDKSIQIIDYKTSTERKIYKHFRQLQIADLLIKNNLFKNIESLLPTSEINKFYLFINKQISSKSILEEQEDKRKLENLLEEITSVLSGYFCNNQPFLYNLQDPHNSDYKHFARIKELNHYIQTLEKDD